MDDPVTDRTEIARIGRALLAHGPFGSVRVRSSDGWMTADKDGDATVRFELALAGSGWPQADLDALRRRLVELVLDAPVLQRPYVSVGFVSAGG